MKTETIKDVPKAKLQQLVASYQHEGYTTQVIKQNDGLYTVIAVR